MTQGQQNYIESVYNALKKHAPAYNIKCYSAIISQAIIESAWGLSTLASKYNNHFGLKCGSSWKGKSVNLATKEEYQVGVVTDIRDNFRAYNSLEEGVKGYLEFINTKRYSNLKGVTDYKTYITLIKQDGYATSSSYINTLINVVEQYNLTKYDNITTITKTDNKKEKYNIGTLVKVSSYYASSTDANSKAVIKNAIGTITYIKSGAKNPYLLNDGAIGWCNDGDIREVINTSLEEVAKEVINGKWGNGEERRKRLTQAGYDYNIIQQEVNRLVR